MDTPPRPARHYSISQNRKMWLEINKEILKREMFSCVLPITQWDKEISAGKALPRTTLGQLCASSLVSWSRPAVTQPGIEPGSVVTPQALRCSALDRCATGEALSGTKNNQPTKMGHNSCSSVARWVCTQSMVGFKKTPMVGTRTAHPLAGILQITDLNPESLSFVSPLMLLSDYSKITVYLNRAILNKSPKLHSIKKCYRWKESSVET